MTKVETRIEAEVQFADCGQLVPQLTLHDVLVQRGEAGATYALGRTERVRGRRATSDVLTGRRGRRIIKAAKEHLDDKTRAAAEEARAFVYSAWCHASFPHKPPASVEETWTVQTDYVSLRVDPERGRLTLGNIQSDSHTAPTLACYASIGPHKLTITAHATSSSGRTWATP